MKALTLALAGLAALGLAAVALASGPLDVDVIDLAGALVGTGAPDAETALALRGPRAATGLAVGAALGAAGAAFQTLFRNPLAAPDLLGVSSGAALGAAAALLLGAGFVAAQGAALAGGVAAVALTLLAARAARAAESTVALVLCGLVTGALAAAALSLVIYLADPFTQLPAISYWLLGSLARAEARDALVAGGLVLAATAALTALGDRLDVLSLGREQARALGQPAGALRLLIIGLATVATAAAVAAAGVVGWLGLLAPHAARLLVGPRAVWLIPTSAILGAAFLTAVDLVARSLGPVEIPLGLLTAAIGAPAFLLLFAALGRRL